MTASRGLAGRHLDVSVEVQCVRSLVTDLRKSYGAVEAVRGVSFTVGRGDLRAARPERRGKDHHAGDPRRVPRRDGGRVEVLGADPGERAPREQVGLVLQDIAVEPYLTVRETVARNAGYYPAPRDVDEVIGLVGLAGRSGGRSRRSPAARSAASTWPWG